MTVGWFPSYFDSVARRPCDTTITATPVIDQDQCHLWIHQWLPRINLRLLPKLCWGSQWRRHLACLLVAVELALLVENVVRKLQLKAVCCYITFRLFTLTYIFHSTVVFGTQKWTYKTKFSVHRGQQQGQVGNVVTYTIRAVFNYSASKFVQEKNNIYIPNANFSILRVRLCRLIWQNGSTVSIIVILVANAKFLAKASSKEVFPNSQINATLTNKPKKQSGCEMETLTLELWHTGSKFQWHIWGNFLPHEHESTYATSYYSSIVS